MRISKMILVLVCLMGVAQLGWCQDHSIVQSQEHGIPGYLNPQTHTFTSGVQNESITAQPSGTYYYGTITVTLIISVASTFPADTSIACSASADVSEYGTNGYFYESAAAIAPAVSNGKTTCTVSMPYYWQLSTPASDPITTSFHVDALNTVTVNGTTEIVSLRHAERDDISATTSVPTTNGTVTTFTYYTRM